MLLYIGLCISMAKILCTIWDTKIIQGHLHSLRLSCLLISSYTCSLSVSFVHHRIDLALIREENAIGLQVSWMTVFTLSGIITTSIVCSNQVCIYKTHLWAVTTNYQWTIVYILLKASPRVRIENTAQGVCWGINTAWGNAECCIYHKTPPECCIFNTHNHRWWYIVFWAAIELRAMAVIIVVEKVNIFWRSFSLIHPS